MRRILTVAAIFLFMAGGAAYANLFTNGDFEEANSEVGLYGTAQNALPVPGWDVYTTLPGWEVDPLMVEIQTNGLNGITAASGERWLELDTVEPGEGGGNSAIGQVVSLQPGGYTVSFAYMPRTGTAGDNTVGVYLTQDGQPDVLLGTADGVGPAGWTYISYTFDILSAGDYGILFKAEGLQNTLGGFIDDASLTMDMNAVPEPATYALVGAGLVGLYFFRRRRA
jgi:hypothetical protein